MSKVKISRVIVAVGVSVAGLAGFGGLAAAAPTASSSAVACVNGDGVMDLAINNPAGARAEFVVTNPETFIASVIDLDPGASQVVTVAGLSDGSVIVPVQFNGNDASVSTVISCDPLVCAQGVPTVITDDNGVQHQACVDSAGAAPALAPPANPDKASLVPQPKPTPTTTGAQLPKTGAGTGGLVIAAILVGSGSIASLLSRRRSSVPTGDRKSS
jgi:LPXTG-motif cell wall-anchored protein